MYDVVTFGCATVDYFVDTEANLFKGSKGGHVRVPFGSKIEVKKIHQHIGGGSANSAIGLRKLGFRTGCISKIGNDLHAAFIKNELVNERVSTEFIQKGKGETAFSIILDASNRDRTILVYKAQSQDLDINKINIDKIETKWFYLNSGGGNLFQVMLKIAESGKRIFFNPSIYFIVDKGLKNLRPILKNTEILSLNLEEARELLKDKKSNTKALLLKISKLGPKISIITNGIKKVYCYSSDNEKFYSIIPRKVKAVETTGAGDAFGSGFLAGYMKKRDIKYALKLGVLNSTSTIQHVGATNGLLSA